MNADGSGVEQLTMHDSDDQCPSWSPDGFAITFSSNRDGDHEIYVMNADGSRAIRLMENPDGHDECPFWSPDGGRIAFSSSWDGDYEIYVMAADGSGSLMRLTDNVGVHDRCPAWWQG